ncbi:beta-ketoacyl-[acyl-carrier-protein] synthase II [Francisella halioticida]|uniref:Beta-ketoacyl-[acyl-carrier-protein] synthase II n=1 Tax=Francisella halioticida TaxID=549298 RepID=A0ABM6M2B0_9GAMM|nr:beta-ketoacyl-ACP synthase [Francisella halioticida]ASG68878.1 beta-ketoacyl-[acyl-carrier-protein] synthase II [Francisella halioticida]BCD91867.1 beta-ketoacyl-[acyl-carrier-protein] synthase II [Francisella halioticida]
MAKNEIYLNALGIINSLGDSKEEVTDSILKNQTGLQTKKNLISGKQTFVGSVKTKLPDISAELKKYNCRNNQLILHACLQIEHQIQTTILKYGKDRVAVVCGTSTSGIDNGEKAISNKLQKETLPKEFSYEQQEPGGLSEFLKDYFKLENMSYTISTACSSSGKAFASAARLLKQNLCDAVIVGGCDTLCDLTLNGFDCLNLVSESICKPFHDHRNGINIGEGAAIFIMSRDKSEISLLGVGESSDGYHITSPDPKGDGAKTAMLKAINNANIEPCNIGYLNLHGTATILNDSMEINAVRNTFKQVTIPCSSTKHLSGHTLGAAGATEIAFCWLLASNKYNPKKMLPKQSISDKNIISYPGIITKDTKYNDAYFMSNSFAFGGNNVSVIIGGSNV